jgi:hypothetical protein
MRKFRSSSPERMSSNGADLPKIVAAQSTKIVVRRTRSTHSEYRNYLEHAPKYGVDA